MTWGRLFLGNFRVAWFSIAEQQWSWTRMKTGKTVSEKRTKIAKTWFFLQLSPWLCSFAAAPLRASAINPACKYERVIRRGCCGLNPSLNSFSLWCLRLVGASEGRHMAGTVCFLSSNETHWWSWRYSEDWITFHSAALGGGEVWLTSGAQSGLSSGAARGGGTRVAPSTFNTEAFPGSQEARKRWRGNILNSFREDVVKWVNKDS